MKPVVAANTPELAAAIARLSASACAGNMCALEFLLAWSSETCSNGFRFTDLLHSTSQDRLDMRLVCHTMMLDVRVWAAWYCSDPQPEPIRRALALQSARPLLSRLTVYGIPERLMPSNCIPREKRLLPGPVLRMPFSNAPLPKDVDRALSKLFTRTDPNYERFRVLENPISAILMSWWMPEMWGGRQFTRLELSHVELYNLALIWDYIAETQARPPRAFQALFEKLLAELPVPWHLMDPDETVSFRKGK